MRPPAPIAFRVEPEPMALALCVEDDRGGKAEFRVELVSVEIGLHRLELSELDAAGILVAEHLDEGVLLVLQHGFDRAEVAQ